MQPIQWITTPEFLAVWKGAFRDAKLAFVDLSGNVRASSKREKTGGLWTQIQHPYPGVHLLAIELQPEITPLAIRLKVWVDQSHPTLYESLRTSQPPELLGQRTVLSANQKPRPSWASQLSSSGISLLGLSYGLSDLSFLGNEASAGTYLRRMGDEFSAWLISKSTLEEMPTHSGVGAQVSVLPSHLSAPQDDSVEASSLAELELDLQRRIEFSRQLSAADRQSRLQSRAPLPRRVDVQTSAFIRSADVIVEVLERAKGICERCGRPAPFARARDGTPYLEVHHLVPLAAEGEDTVANAVALCPNCHRFRHYGNAT